jgi:hypothetical protein
MQRTRPEYKIQSAMGLLTTWSRKAYDETTKPINNVEDDTDPAPDPANGVYPPPHHIPEKRERVEPSERVTPEVKKIWDIAIFHWRSMSDQSLHRYMSSSSLIDFEEDTFIVGVPDIYAQTHLTRYCSERSTLWGQLRNAYLVSNPNANNLKISYVLYDHEQK